MIPLALSKDILKRLAIIANARTYSLTWIQRAQILIALNKGEPIDQIQIQLKCSRSTIYRLKNKAITLRATQSIPIELPATGEQRRLYSVALNLAVGRLLNDRARSGRQPRLLLEDQETILLKLAGNELQKASRF